MIANILKTGGILCINLSINKVVIISNNHEKKIHLFFMIMKPNAEISMIISKKEKIYPTLISILVY